MSSTVNSKRFHMHFFKTLCLALLMAVIGGGRSLAADARWQRAAWQGEPAWCARSNGWTAIVSEARGRLVYLGRDGNSGNLLYAIPSLPRTLDAIDPPSWGGHRLWLGPQSAWKKGWPPPVEWEFSDAARVRARDDVLEVSMSRGNAAMPQLSRRYSWSGQDLVCEARWEGAERPACAIQIFAVPSSARIEAVLTPSPGLPHGFALLPVWQRPGVRTHFELPVHDVQVKGREALIQFEQGRQKIGLRASALRCVFPDSILTVSRFEEPAENAVLPDDGLVTQVYIGIRKEPYIELEQLSPMIGQSRGVFAVKLHPEVRPLHEN